MLSLLLAAAAAPAATAAPLGAATAKAAATALPGRGPVAQPAPPLDLSKADFSYLHKSPLAQHLPWLTHTFAAFFVLAAVLLVVLLAVQTTKQEGLSGTIGGRVESSYRRLGFEGQLARLTSLVAIALVFFGTLLSITGI